MRNELTKLQHGSVCEENDTLVCICQQSCQSIRKELEDRLAKSGSEDEESNDELSENANNDRLPVDVLSVPAGDI